MDVGVGYYGCGYRCADVDVSMVVGVSQCVGAGVNLAIESGCGGGYGCGSSV